MTSGVDTVLAILHDAGARRYGGEMVSQLAHALQCATLAERELAPSHAIAAALLHDIGHLVGDGDAGLAAKGVDARHEDIGADYLAQWFDADVCEATRLHVAAKRYLCHAEAGYFESLSPASVRSLAVQGGPMTAVEASEFMALPQAESAARLRRWDDWGKDVDMVTPGLEHFRQYLEPHQI
jgi:phosphonate degradation associated HDIG domain protein